MQKLASPDCIWENAWPVQALCGLCACACPIPTRPRAEMVTISTARFTVVCLSDTSRWCLLIPGNPRDGHSVSRFRRNVCHLGDISPYRCRYNCGGLMQTPTLSPKDVAFYREN